MKTALQVLATAAITGMLVSNAFAQNTFPSTGSAGVGTTNPNSDHCLK